MTNLKIETVENLYNRGFRVLGVVVSGVAESLEDECGNLKREVRRLKFELEEVKLQALDDACRADL